MSSTLSESEPAERLSTNHAAVAAKKAVITHALITSVLGCQRLAGGASEGASLRLSSAMRDATSRRKVAAAAAPSIPLTLAMRRMAASAPSTLPAAIKYGGDSSAASPTVSARVAMAAASTDISTCQLKLSHAEELTNRW